MNQDISKTVLNNAKDVVGVSEGDPVFDEILLGHIRASATDVNLISGLRPAPLTSETTWEEFFPEASEDQRHRIAAYITLKTQVLFDPPTSPTIAQAYNNRLSELSFSIQITSEGE